MARAEGKVKHRYTVIQCDLCDCYEHPFMITRGASLMVRLMCKKRENWNNWGKKTAEVLIETVSNLYTVRPCITSQ